MTEVRGQMTEVRRQRSDEGRVSGVRCLKGEDRRKVMVFGVRLKAHG
jgi:hypothetical protein